MRCEVVLQWVGGWSNHAKKGFHLRPPKATNGSIKCPPLLSVDSPDVWIPSTSNSLVNHSISSSQDKAANEQTAALLGGKSIANDIDSIVAGEILEMKNSMGRTPGLGVVPVGERKDSQVFVRTKMKACKKVGIASVVAQLSEECNEDQVSNAVSRMNENPSIHGIIVQLPLPKVIPTCRFVHSAYERREDFEYRVQKRMLTDFIPLMWAILQ